ncbi:amidohydrolase family protein [Microvirga aerilata]|jgi:predicted TIM-barrel fold metal-dependent hydrolase|uniref:Amidohydrolase family protein n=1 Tax=Microvirga aerilata TaxID=670292 RepID=A0A937D3U0_9HYPH|nr:amidohydrolase family protein [Microvirga aerilata]MBL0406785.1 amidohydrolase family protein [Microvirga aerilata]
MSVLPPRPNAVIDAHHHIWDLANDIPWLKQQRVPFRYGDYSPICCNYMPADYRADTAGWPITGSVYIEAEWSRTSATQESRWVAAVAAETGVPSAMVAWCDFASVNVGELLASYASVPIVRGIRHKPAAVSSPADARRGAAGSMDDSAWREGYGLLAQAGLSYDLQTPWWHLDAAADLARDFPATQIIINHTGLPADRSPEALVAWRKALEVAAAQPNVAIKISGIGQPGRPWRAEENAPVIRDAIAIFGVNRAMFASNFPVDSLISDFDTIFSGFLAATADRTEAERDKLFHDNAARFYRLQSVQ